MPSKQPITLGKLAQRSFEHLLETGKKVATKNIPRRIQHIPQWVPPKDRIALWNIGPGDRVRVNTGTRKGKIGTVDWVDRKLNRVYLRESEFARPKSVPTEKKNAIFNDPAFIPNMKVYSPVPIHYSNVSLVLQRSPEQEARDEFTRQQGEGSSGPLPEAVATRLRATNVRYDWKQRRWQWKRLAENVAEIDPVTGHKLSADWPKQDRFTKFTTPKPYIPTNPAPFDTSYEEATRATFVPPEDPVQEPPPELKLRNIEFVNVYGRAKRNERWHARKAEEAEVNDLAS